MTIRDVMCTRPSTELKTPSSRGSVVLNDHYHPALSFTVLNQLRRRQQLCDVVIRIRDARFPAHGVVLAASSPYFLERLSSQVDSSQSQRQEIVLRDKLLDVDAVDSLVEFVYTSIVRIRLDTVHSLYYAASMLLFERVEKACCKFILDSLQPHNVIPHLLFAIENDYTKVRDGCLRFLAANFKDLSTCQVFLHLHAAQVKEILELLQPVFSSSNIDVPPQPLLAWVGVSPTERRGYLPHLLQLCQSQLTNGEQHEVLTKAIVESDKNLFSRVVKLLQQDSTAPNQETMSKEEEDDGSDSNILSEPVQVQPFSPESNAIFAVGGNSVKSVSNTAECYIQSEGVWKHIAKAPQKQSHSVLVAIGHRLFSIGGYNGKKRLASINIYDMNADSWSEGPTMSSPRCDFAAAVVGEEIYCIGGYDGSNHLDTVEVFHLSSMAFSPGPSLLHARSYVQAGVLRGNIYAVGGTDGSCRLQSVERMVGKTGKWRFAAPLITPRSRAGVAALGGYLYAVGGYDGTTHLKTIERYDPSVNSWTLVTNMSTPRNSPGVTVLGGQLYVAGGYNGKSILTSAEKYNPEEDEWSPVAPMKLARCDFGITSAHYPSSAQNFL